MGSEGDRGRAKNKLALLLGMQGKKERTAFEVKRPGADGTVGRPSDDHSLYLRCLVNSSKTAVQQPREGAWSKLRRAQRSDGVNQSTLALFSGRALCTTALGLQDRSQDGRLSVEIIMR